MMYSMSCTVCCAGGSRGYSASLLSRLDATLTQIQSRLKEVSLPPDHKERAGALQSQQSGEDYTFAVAGKVKVLTTDVVPPISAPSRVRES